MANKVRGPQQTTVLDRDVAVLRKLNMKRLANNAPGIYEILAETNIVPGVHEQQMAWFDEGYVSNDHPRDSIVSKFMIDYTLGFAVARTDTGEILAKFKTEELSAADKAAAGAKIKLDIDFSLDDDDDEDADLEDNDDDENLSTGD